MVERSPSEAQLFAKRSFHQNEGNIMKTDFTVVSYNTLADAYLLPCPAYKYCHERFKTRNKVGSHRHELLLQELKWLDSDILCLQEVDQSYYDDLLHEQLFQLGYQGHFAMTNESGLATFFRSDVFELVMKKEVGIYDEMKEMCEESGQEQLKDYLQIPHIVLMMALKHKVTNQLLVLGNVHTVFDWYEGPVREVLQVSAASKILHKFKESLKASFSSLQNVPHIFCGDFNIEPHFPAYKILECGQLDKDDLEILKTRDYIKYCEDEEGYGEAPKTNEVSEKDLEVLTYLGKYFESPLRQRSTYKTVLGKEPETTNHVSGKDYWTLDYLWYSSDSLHPTGVLDVVPFSLVDSVVGLPNEFFPSDHLSLKASYSFIN